MRFTALPVHSLEDVTLNFDQLQSRVGVGGTSLITAADTITPLSWNFLAHPDVVTNVAVPMNAVVNVTYRAHLQKTVGTGGVYAMLCAAPIASFTASSFVPSPFGNSNGGNNPWTEVASMFSGNSPVISGVICTSGWLAGTSATSTGLAAYGTSGSGDPSDEWVSTGPQLVGAPIALAMPAGIYSFGVAYDADSGVTCAVSNRCLFVEVKTFK